MKKELQFWIDYYKKVYSLKELSYWGNNSDKTTRGLWLMECVDGIIAEIETGKKDNSIVQYIDYCGDNRPTYKGRMLYNKVPTIWNRKESEGK